MKDEYKSYIRWGVTAVGIFTTCVFIFFFLLRLDVIANFLGKAMGAIQSIIYGLVIAFVLQPVAAFWQNKIEEKMLQKTPQADEKAKRKIHNMARGIGVFIAMLLTLFVIAMVVGMIVPRVVESVMNVVASYSGFLAKIEQWIYTLSAKHPDIFSAEGQVYEKVLSYVENWVNTDLLAGINSLVTGLTSYVIGFFNSLLNWVVGLIVATYTLMEREKFNGQAKKIIYAVLPFSAANVMIEIARKTSEIFIGFISGKLIDSAIIGVLCFIGLSILKMPYALLVSVVVGVTNVIPFFGPYIGAVPSAILILLVNPIKCLYFIIFILVLQQIDGNIIGPKILGNSTGLSAFWVIFSILLFGGLFGFIGMLIGVPTFAVIYYLIKIGVEYLLQRKKLPVETSKYKKLYRIEEESLSLVYRNEMISQTRIDKKPGNKVENKPPKKKRK